MGIGIDTSCVRASEAGEGRTWLGGIDIMYMKRRRRTEILGREYYVVGMRYLHLCTPKRSTLMPHSARGRESSDKITTI
jgi:hypothetical protein